MGQIQITAAELESRKAQLLSLYSSAVEEVTETDMIVGNLKAEWEGEASEAFQASYKEKSARLTQALEMVKKIIDSLDKIIETYSAAEAVNIQIAAK